MTNDNIIDFHHEELQRKHGDLEKKISEEQGRPMPDSITLRKLKRRKLAIKDEIERYKRSKSTSMVPRQPPAETSFSVA